MPSRVLYHCPCSTDFSPSFGPVQPSTSSHLLPSLYFCEECDSIRCSLCTTKDLTTYYCSNCLFDVPLASIKSERAKCPRNCFSCPICTSTLAVLPSDSSEGHGDGHWDPLSAEASTGEPPWYLSCPTCKWDSKEVGLSFEKATGLSLQVQRHEDNAADVLEFNHLRSHFDSFLRLSAEPASSSAAARSSKLLRDVPSLAQDITFAPFSSNRKAPRRKVEGDENIPFYTASMTWDAGRDIKRYVGVEQGPEGGKALGAIGRKEQNQLEFVQEQLDDSGLTGMEQRWSSIAEQSVQVKDLGPCRMPLRTKQTKRCSVCRHIIIRPDSKPTSSRYKIRLLALNHLPEIQIRPPNTTTAVGDDRRRSAFATLGRRKIVAVDEENLYAGRTYLFEASFLNPLDDPMVVRLHIARPPPTGGALPDKDGSPTKHTQTNRFHWTVSPTSSSFPVSAFNAVWELDEEDDELLELNGRTKQMDVGDVDDEEDDANDSNRDEAGDDRDHKRSRTDVGGRREGRRKGQGILRRKGHETVIGLELALSREATGDVEFPMQVTFSYRPESEGQQRTSSSKDSDNKSFSFWTFVRLGRIASDAGSAGMRLPSSPDGTTEARRSALDKRRSIMGINLPSRSAAHATLPTDQPTSPLSSLKEATIVSDGSPKRSSMHVANRSNSVGGEEGGEMTGRPAQAQSEISIPRNWGSLAELDEAN